MVMKDPKVENLVKQFKTEIAQVNKTWYKLQAEGMYIDVSAESNGNYNEPKSFVVKRMTQNVEYFKEEQK
jgi:hypothetical protein